MLSKPAAAGNSRWPFRFLWLWEIHCSPASSARRFRRLCLSSGVGPTLTRVPIMNRRACIKFVEFTVRWDGCEEARLHSGRDFVIESLWWLSDLAKRRSICGLRFSPR